MYVVVAQPNSLLNGDAYNYAMQGGSPSPNGDVSLPPTYPGSSAATLNRSIKKAQATAYRMPPQQSGEENGQYQFGDGAYNTGTMA
jgi:hypothetical protein